MAKSKQSENRNTWKWVPSLYFAEGIPYVLVMTLSVIFYKRMGISNKDIAFYTSLLYWPWVLKFLWSPFIDMYKTKRFWIIIMQLLIGGGLAGVAFTTPLPNFMQYTLAFFFLLAFSSATHDIAADGFYMLGLSKHDQAFFVGIRSTFYRLAMLTGQGLLVILAGYFEAKTGLPPVELTVNAIELNDSTVFNPEDITINTNDQSLYVVSAEDLSISRKNIGKSNANNILKSVENWNTKHGFYLPEESVKAKSSWWKRTVSDPLKTSLKNKFNSKSLEDFNEVGNIGITYFHLNKKPGEGETVVFNISYSKGDKSIGLAKSYRIEFNERNWNKPALVAFQVDPKLQNDASAVFSGLSGNIPYAWALVFGIITLVFLVFYVYHRIVLPKPESDRPNVTEGSNPFKEFISVFAEFFRKKNIGVIVTFLLVYRLGESQLVKLASPFLLDPREMDGLGLTTGQIGLIYGTIGIIALSLGGIIGGIVASRKGLKYWLWWMVIAMNLPNLVYVFLSYTMPSSLWIVGSSVAIEQFGYGFGFTAYMLYMIYVSDGKHKTAHFAITTAFMAFGMMIPGMISGWLQEIIGYQSFFIWVMICTIPSFLVIPFLKVDPKFGVKNKE